MELLPSGCRATGKAEPFFYFLPQRTMLSVMLYTEKIASKVNNSILTRTRDCESVVDKKYLIEKNAQNGAYYFIPCAFAMAHRAARDARRLFLSLLNLKNGRG
jgi:hypothetical protein